MNHPHSSKKYIPKARPLIPWWLFTLVMGGAFLSAIPNSQFPIPKITITVESNDSTNYGRLPGN